jgi:BirA family transcriptional regulator, biotin operon repressor / biotin---[acetyl-CoA-carboxylase] ligase
MPNDWSKKSCGDSLKLDEISRGLGTRLIARRIIYDESTKSTNDVAKQLAEAGEPEGTLVIADEQTAGRGRLGRTWIAPPRSSILMSLILRPALAPQQMSRVTMAVSLGACSGIEHLTGLVAQLKWPNDILLRGRKCAGILSEAKIEADRLEYIVTGLGMNANFSASGISGMPANATTLADELGRSVPREALVRSLAREIDRYYLRLLDGDDLRSEWKSRMLTLGKYVRADIGRQTHEGIAEDIDEDGSLLLRQADGSVVRLVAGDVTLASEQQLGA